MNEAREQFRQRYLADLRRRLCLLCADWPDARFEGLIAQIADIDQKYRDRERVDAQVPDLPRLRRESAPPAP